MASESTAANGGEKKKKKKKFGRIRGLLTGESRRERKAKKAAARAAAQQRGQAPPLNVDDDAETVYGVNVETGRTAMQQDTNGAPAGEIVAPKPGGHSLQVILLLLDPHTRRFELLQLEFDSVKAVVRDVLAQVPHSVTEEALCKQKYVGVCDTKGVELINATRLADFCHGSEILLAIPEGLPAKECSRLAKPILTDENVMQMVSLFMLSQD